ncbi:MAG: histidine kinase [Defluviitaleaceae bacterium]|nr:histidine kinase [Defluviitaleaceae bacterium]
MKLHFIAARGGVGIMLLIFWGLVDNPLFAVHFLLILIGLSAVRYRIKPYRFLPLLEAAASGVYAILWPPALLGLWLPMISIFENKWNKREAKTLEQNHTERSKRYMLEAQIDQSTKDSINAARLAEMTERARIAQDIHDHVGHEMHGALIALQTAIKLHENKDPRTKELMAKSLTRMESASATLRETVHNLRPAYTIGPDTLEQICKDFTYCPVEFSKSGDLADVVHWEMIAANLKELLTNIAKHSNATAAAVKVDGNAKYVRMTVKDNGQTKKSPTPGLGLSGMKDRIRMAGGTLSVSDGDGFMVVFVLPKA